MVVINGEEYLHLRPPVYHGFYPTFYLPLYKLGINNIQTIIPALCDYLSQVNKSLENGDSSVEREFNYWKGHLYRLSKENKEVPVVVSKGEDIIYAGPLRRVALLCLLDLTSAKSKFSPGEVRELLRDYGADTISVLDSKETVSLWIIRKLQRFRYALDVRLLKEFISVTSDTLGRAGLMWLTATRISEEGDTEKAVSMMKEVALYFPTARFITSSNQGVNFNKRAWIFLANEARKNEVEVLDLLGEYLTWASKSEPGAVIATVDLMAGLAFFSNLSPGKVAGYIERISKLRKKARNELRDKIIPESSRNPLFEGEELDDYAEELRVAPENISLVTIKKVKFYSHPFLLVEGPTLGEIKRGDTLRFLYSGPWIWIKVKYKGKIGWVEKNSVFSLPPPDLKEPWIIIGQDSILYMENGILITKSENITRIYDLNRRKIIADNRILLNNSCFCKSGVYFLMTSLASEKRKYSLKYFDFKKRHFLWEKQLKEIKSNAITHLDGCIDENVVVLQYFYPNKTDIEIYNRKGNLEKTLKIYQKIKKFFLLDSLYCFYFYSHLLKTLQVQDIKTKKSFYIKLRDLKISEERAKIISVSFEKPFFKVIARENGGYSLSIFDLEKLKPILWKFEKVPLYFHEGRAVTFKNGLFLDVESNKVLFTYGKKYIFWNLIGDFLVLFDAKKIKIFNIKKRQEVMELEPEKLKENKVKDILFSPNFVAILTPHNYIQVLNETF